MNADVKNAGEQRDDVRNDATWRFNGGPSVTPKAAKTTEAAVTAYNGLLSDNGRGSMSHVVKVSSLLSSSNFIHCLSLFVSLCSLFCVTSAMLCSFVYINIWTMTFLYHTKLP